MGQEITLAHFQQWLVAFSSRIVEQERYLTQLDAAIGDADHGANMRRGVEKVMARLADADHPCEDVSSLMRTIAMTLISNVGGAAGPLYGAFFLRAATAAPAHPQVTLVELDTMFRAGLEGVQQRGKAQTGDKTMIDALSPAVDALSEAARRGATVAEALTAAAQAAEAGMHATIDLIANRGRASYLGARAIGHQDPGATSVYYLIDTAAATLGTPIPAALRSNRSV
jgi:dihydroxyacetone kinase-like protein